MRVKRLFLAVGVAAAAALLASACLAFWGASGKGPVVPAGKADRGKKEQADGSIRVGALRCIGNSRQAVVVTAEGYGVSDAFLQTYEKTGSVWKRVMAPVQASVGVAGFAAPGEKREGDGCSPSGAFSLEMCFGNKPNPGVRLPYRQVDSNCYWVDDPESKFYNTFQTAPADGRWKSAEDLGLSGSVYNYAAVIGYNTKERTPGMGSAIFLHEWKNPGDPTAGCVAVSEPDLLSVLKWLDPAKSPVIIEGTIGAVTKM